MRRERRYKYHAHWWESCTAASTPRQVMTKYYRKLDAAAQNRYLEKLKLLNLEGKDDPYEASNSHKFIDNMTKWPSIEYGRIFCYYIQHPGVYTRWQLMQWKSLEAFNYFDSGHVRQIKLQLPCLSGRRRVAPELIHTSMEPLQEEEELPGARHVPTPPPPQLTTKPTDYEIYQSIGVGCFGVATILIAQHKPSCLFTVLRSIDLELLTFSQLEEVQHEMKLSQLILHRNIACYICSFVVGTKLWAVQPLMHYGSCADIMHSAQPFRDGFKENVIGVILRDVIQGLEYLHSLGYVHRSIRAKHFLIHEDGVVKLSGLRSMVSMIDGGSRVKALHGHFSNTVDNICWLAPEVLAQDLSGYSYQSDIYSVGIAALELVTGEAPFAGLPITEIMMLKLRGHPPVLMRRQEGQDPTQLSNTFSKVVDQCVHPNPACRPSPLKLLSMSFLKLRKKSVGYPSLKELLRPVVPLDTSKLTPSDSFERSEVESEMEQLRIQESWVY